jgi:hypothetical protein
MTVSPEKLHELLSYCTDFAKTMLNGSGEFYPFGAAVAKDHKVRAVGGYDGNEYPNPQDIYRLLADGFTVNAKDGSILAAALAANVNIPDAYEAPTRDGVRVHLECVGYSRFIYTPFRITKKGLFKKSHFVEFFEPFSVEVPPSFFMEAPNV